MELSSGDIQRIVETNEFDFKQEDFCNFNNGYNKLKNIDGHCFFLNPDTLECKIYPLRPEGCRYYPLVYNLDKEKCELDIDCPHKMLFYSHPPLFKSKCKALKKWVTLNLIEEIRSNK